MDQQPALSAEDQEMQKFYQEYLQKCCEVGQIEHQLDQLESQKAQMEKSLDVSKRAAKSAAAKHKELQQKKYQGLKAKEPTLEMKDA